MMPLIPARLTIGPVIVVKPKYRGWRCLHTAEGGRWVPLGMPEERTPDNPRALQMTQAIQQMSWNLMRHANPTITSKQWTAVHAYDRCFNNGTGFEDSNDLRANYIMGENLNAPLPAYDKAMRICGGTFITGEVSGDKLLCLANVDGIDANLPLPTPQEIIYRHWFTYAVSVGNSYEKISHFPQGNGGAVVVPFIFRDSITFPLEWFERWESDELPDPLRVYR